MSDDTLQAQRERERKQQIGAMLSDLEMLQVGVPMSTEHLVARWISNRAIAPEHLAAARRAVARRFHPDRHGGSGRLMTIANTAIDRTLAELKLRAALPQSKKEASLK